MRFTDTQSATFAASQSAPEGTLACPAAPRLGYGAWCACRGSFRDAVPDVSGSVAGRYRPMWPHSDAQATGDQGT